MRQRNYAFLLTILALASGNAALADDYESFNDPWRVYIGAFHASVDSTIGINGEILPPGPPLDLEDLFGVDDSKTVAWGGISWHFKDRHAVDVEMFSLNRNASLSQPFTPPIQIGDTILEAGEIGTNYDTDVTRVSYGYSLIRDERSDLQIKAGLHIARLRAEFTLSGQLCDPTTVPSAPPGCPPLGTGSELADVSAPLPHIGLAYSYAMTPKFAFNVTGTGFAVELDEIDGSIYELTADIGWQLWSNVGVGAGARYFKVDMTSAGEELNGSFKFEYLGPTIYLYGTF